MLLVVVVVLDMGFHVIASVVFMVTEFTLKKSDLAVSTLNVSAQFELVCQNFSTLFTLNFDAFFEGSPLLLSHSTKPLVSRNSFDFHPTVGAGDQLLFASMLIPHVILQGKHRLQAYLALGLLLCVCQNMCLQDVFVGKCL